MNVQAADISFAFVEPAFGRNRSLVAVGPAGLELTHPQLPDGIEVDLDDLCTAGRYEPGLFDTISAGGRLRLLDFSFAGAAANVVVLFKRRQLVEGFAFGAERTLDISLRERRHGVGVDGVLLPLADADAFLAELHANDVAFLPLADTVGRLARFRPEPAPPSRAPKRALLQAASYYGLPALALNTAALYRAGFGLAMLALLLAAVAAWAITSAAVTSLVEARPSQPSTPRQAALRRGAMVGALAVSGIALVVLGAPLFLTGAVTGLPLGLLIGLSMPAAGEARRTHALA